MLRRRRQALHARVAGLLTERFAELVEREPELAGHDFARAVLPARPVPYWEAAGERALAPRRVPGGRRPFPARP